MSHSSFDRWLRMRLIPNVNRLRQSVNLTLLCDTSSDSPNPTLVSYTAGALSLEWATPDACPRSGDSSSPSSSDGGGGGFVSFVKTLFWLIIIGLILYFAIGKLLSDLILSIVIALMSANRDILQPSTIFCQGLGPYSTP